MHGANEAVRQLLCDHDALVSLSSTGVVLRSPLGLPLHTFTYVYLSPVYELTGPGTMLWLS